jgi:hypothetical protein
LPSARVVKVENLLHKLEKLIVERSSFVVMTSGGSAHLKISIIHLYICTCCIFEDYSAFFELWNHWLETFFYCSCSILYCGVGVGSRSSDMILEQRMLLLFASGFIYWTD